MPAFQGIWMINRTLGDEVRTHMVPDNAGVIRSMEARGWEVTDLPTELDSDDIDFQDALEQLTAEDDEPEDEPEQPAESEAVAPATEPKKEVK